MENLLGRIMDYFRNLCRAHENNARQRFTNLINTLKIQLKALHVPTSWRSSPRARNVKLESVFDRVDRVHTGGFLESIQAVAGAVARTKRQSDTVRPPRPGVLNHVREPQREVRATRGADAQRNDKSVGVFQNEC